MNFKKLIEYLQSFATQHEQINTFYAGQTWNFQAGKNLYPAMVCTVLPSQISSGESVISIQIAMMDIQNKDNSNVIEIQSDMFEVMQDLYSYFALSNGLTYINEAIAPEPFQDFTDDVLDGWLATFNFRFAYENNTCIIPLVTGD